MDVFSIIKTIKTKTTNIKNTGEISKENESTLLKLE
jgi:hypothetical protein